MIAPPKPPADALEALMKEARARQLRRRKLAAATVALATGLGLAIYALAGGPDARSSGAPSPAAVPPLCRASQLATAAIIGASAGTTFVPVTLANEGNRGCLLPGGRPKVQILLGGSARPIAQRSWSTGLGAFGRRAGDMLAPGRTAFVELAWQDACPRPALAPTTGAVTFVLRFANGLRLTAAESSPDVPGPALPGCGEAVSPAPSVLVSGLLQNGK